MEIHEIGSFLDYYGRIRARTQRVVACIPPDKLEWTYQPGKFTIGDLIRHIATIERYMYAETVLGRPSRYPGCGRQLADGYENVLTYCNTLHQESLAIFGSLTPEQLRSKCRTPEGSEISVWKWLRALIEHEIHHRGQIYLYLALLGVPTPPLYGLTAEEVQARSV